MFSAERSAAVTGGVGGWETTEGQRQGADLIKTGRVVEADYAKARVKVGIGDPEDPEGYILTGWLPMAGGRSDEWNPLKIGEAVSVVSEAGEIQNGVVYPGSIYNEDNPAPGDRGDLWRKQFGDGTVIEYDEAAKVYKVGGASGATLKLTVGDASFTVQNGEVKIEVGGVSLTISGNGAAFTGGAVTHDGKAIDKTHRHKGVSTGGALTEEPA